MSDTKEKLKEKLQQSIKAKKIGRMPKEQKEKHIEQYYNKLGITREQVAQVQQSIIQNQKNNKI
jgi:hypothetical protein